MSIGLKPSTTSQTTGQQTSRGSTWDEPLSGSDLRLALIGCGPRGMYCLERLTHVLETHPTSRRVRVDIYEPAPYPGAGNIYDLRQPAYLRMNFSNRHINACHPNARLGEGSPKPILTESFLQWNQSRQLCDNAPESYAPRSVIGGYLHDAYQQVIARLSNVADVSLHPSQVTNLRRIGSRWRIWSERMTVNYDSVVVTVGHEGWRCSQPHRPDEVIADVACVFPTTERLSETAIPAGSVVAMRGFGLTWIDAVLALTEGRGGKFVQDEHKRWSYTQSGREPAKLHPFSRTGRPMLPKVDASIGDGLSTLWNRYRRKLARLRRDASSDNDRLLHFRTDVWPLVIAAADEALRSMRPDLPSVDVSDWYRDWKRWRICGDDVRHRLQHAYDVATGVAPVDEAWALGETWRRLYSKLVAIVSHDGLVAESLSDFESVAREMERIAFGPPAENVGRLLALHDVGLIDFNNLIEFEPCRSSNGSLSLCCDGESVAVDKLVDATIPGPFHSQRGGLLERLMNDPMLSPTHGPLRIDPQGRPLGEEDQPLPNIAVFGRSTEASVLGNDTLSRTLHSEIDRWSEAFAASLAK
ncbi:MAG: FAD/NAD(P)-binding protein [Pirellulaceae bacterium]